MKHDLEKHIEAGTLDGRSCHLDMETGEWICDICGKAVEIELEA